jgi:hypothetical protein
MPKVKARARAQLSLSQRRFKLRVFFSAGTTYPKSGETAICYMSDKTALPTGCPLASGFRFFWSAAAGFTSCLGYRRVGSGCLKRIAEEWRESRRRSLEEELHCRNQAPIRLRGTNIHLDSGPFLREIERPVL